jgi:hypothetical protein
MTYVFTTPSLGMPPIASTNLAGTSMNAAGRFPGALLGQIVRATDPTYGEGEFICLLGAANTVVGSMVTWNATTYQTVLSADTANEAGPVAIAMAANLAGYYGWYQISGLAVVKKTNVSWEPQKKAYQSATTGRVMDTSASGKAILGAKSANLTTVTTTTSTIVLSINRPHKQGPIT